MLRNYRWSRIKINSFGHFTLLEMFKQIYKYQCYQIKKRFKWKNISQHCFYQIEENFKNAVSFQL